jgi:hypothetical protein
VGFDLGGELEGGFELVPEGLHGEVAGAVKPFLVRLGGQGADETQAALLAGGEARDGGAALEFRAEPLEEVGALEVFAVCPRLAVEGPGLLDAFLAPGAELGILRLPAAGPGTEAARTDWASGGSPTFWRHTPGGGCEFIAHRPDSGSWRCIGHLPRATPKLPRFSRL